MAGKAFLDCRNVYDRPHLEKFGFKYDCFGRADHTSACRLRTIMTAKNDKRVGRYDLITPMLPCKDEILAQVREVSHVRELHPGRRSAAARRGTGRRLRRGRRRRRGLRFLGPVRGPGHGRGPSRARGHHHPLHLRRHHGGHRPAGRRAGVRGHPARGPEHRPGQDRSRHHPQDPGHHAGAHFRGALRHGSHQRHRRQARSRGRGRHGPGLRNALPRASPWDRSAA